MIQPETLEVAIRSIHDVIARRRTVSQYQPGPLPDGVLERALLAAHQAPCHKRTWPWRFSIVGPQTRQALLDVALAMAPLDPERTAKLRVKLLHPSALVVVSQVLAEDPFRRQEDYAACATAIQNAMLSLEGDGIGSKWGTGKLTRLPGTYAAVGIQPEFEAIIGFLWMGTPVKPCAEPDRPPLETVTRTLA